MKEGGFFKKLKTGLCKLIYGYDKLEEWLLCGSLVLTTLIIFAQIIMRSIFNHSLSWSEELTRYIFIWQIWLGTSIAQRTKSHIKVELLFTFLKGEKAKAAIDIFATAVWMAFSVFLTWNGWQLVMQVLQRGTLSGALRLPMYFVFAALPVSSLLLCLRLLGQLKEDGLVLAGKMKEEVK